MLQSRGSVAPIVGRGQVRRFSREEVSLLNRIVPIVASTASCPVRYSKESNRRSFCHRPLSEPDLRSISALVTEGLCYRR